MPARSFAELAGALARGRSAAEVELERPAEPAHGDYATNVGAPARAERGSAPARARRGARRRGAGAARRSSAPRSPARASSTSCSRDAWFARARWARSSRPAPASARASPSARERVQVEMVSANPTGPITVASARNGAIRRLASPGCSSSPGHEVEREYYYNDAGAQMERFRASVEAVRRGEEPPEDGYRGDYVARARERCRGDPVPPMLERIEATLERFRIHFDSWALQSELERAAARAAPRLDTYEQDGAVWARSSRVRRRAGPRDHPLGETGEPTYRAADVVYLVDKLERGFDRAIYVLGADHHGTRNWYAAVARMLGYDPERVEVLLYQLVHLTQRRRADEDVEAPRRRRLPRRLHRRDRRRRGPLVPRQPQPRPDDRDRRRPRRGALREEPRLLRPVRARADRRHPAERRRRGGLGRTGGRARARRSAIWSSGWPSSRAVVAEAAERRGPARRSRRTRSASRTTSTASTTTTGSSKSEAQAFRLGAVPGDAGGDRPLPRPRRGRGARADVVARRSGRRIPA